MILYFHSKRHFSMDGRKNILKLDFWTPLKKRRNNLLSPLSIRDKGPYKPVLNTPPTPLYRGESRNVFCWSYIAPSSTYNTTYRIARLSKTNYDTASERGVLLSLPFVQSPRISNTFLFHFSKVWIDILFQNTLEPCNPNYLSLFPYVSTQHPT